MTLCTWLIKKMKAKGWDKLTLEVDLDSMKVQEIHLFFQDMADVYGKAAADINALDNY